MYKTLFAKRNKWKHYEKRLIPMMCLQDGQSIVGIYEEKKALGSMAVVGYGTRGAMLIDLIEVTLPNGVVVPCTRVSDPQNAYVICQNMGYMAFRP